MKITLKARYAKVLCDFDRDRPPYGHVRYRDTEMEIVNRLLGVISYYADSQDRHLAGRRRHAAWALGQIEKTLADIAARKEKQ
jgi:hypothetical protein